VVALLVLTSTILQTGLAPNVAGSGDPGDGAIAAGAGRVIDPTATATSPVVVPAVATEAPDEPTATETTEPEESSQPAATETTEPTDEGGDDGDISLDGQGAGGEVDDEPTEPSDDEGRRGGVEDGQMPEDPEVTARTAAMEGAILPEYRILAYYGHPADERMGILGQFDMEELLAQLLDEAATYEACRPGPPRHAGLRGDRLGRPGRSDVGRELAGPHRSRHDHGVRRLHRREGHPPHPRHPDRLHLGQGGHGDGRGVPSLPERPPRHRPRVLALRADIPGEVIGGVDAEEVTYAQERLVEICAEEGIPPKVLIVHRFRHEMIRDDDKVKPIEGVQLVIDMDGFGHPGLKIDSYTIFITDKDPEYAGSRSSTTRTCP
jgi:hypothetical protein